VRKPFVYMGLAGLFLAGFIVGVLLAFYCVEGLTPLAFFRLVP
jgi:hypothetical protein